MPKFFQTVVNQQNISYLNYRILPMKYVKLGNSNLNVSRVCMGCMGFGDFNIKEQFKYFKIVFILFKHI